MPPDENPFERFGIDPARGPAAITERMRELIEDAATEQEKARIRAAWEELTLHPARRLKAALGAHPDGRASIGRRPPPPRRIEREPFELALIDLALRPSILSALGESDAPALPDVPPSRDPVLT